jgi:hypothetical protein
VTKNKKIRQWVTRTHFLKLNIKHSLPVHIKVSSIYIKDLDASGWQ